MNTVPGVKVNEKEEHTDVIRERQQDDGLMEIGRVTETKGSFSGSKGDGGFGVNFT